MGKGSVAWLVKNWKIGEVSSKGGVETIKGWGGGVGGGGLVWFLGGGGGGVFGFKQ